VTGAALSTANLDAYLTLLRDTLNILITRDPLSTNADGTPLTSAVSSATAATVLAALAGTGGAALIGTLQPGANVEAAIASLVSQVTALNLIPQADLIKRTGAVPFTADQPMGGHKITGLADATATGDAVTFGQLQAVATSVVSTANSLRRDGSNTMLADLNVGSHKITNMADGVAATDAATKGQVDAVRSSIATIGEVAMFGGTVAPTGWLLCNGAAVSRTTYATLFAAIGTTWGGGDGSTTFNVPNPSGRVPLATGAGSGLTSRSIAQSGGEETHVLTQAELPALNVNLLDATNGYAQGGQASTGHNGMVNVTATNIGGSASPHNTMPPWMAFTFIIRALPA
jgi:microcystin-dependent protein